MPLLQPDPPRKPDVFLCRGRLGDGLGDDARGLFTSPGGNAPRGVGLTCSLGRVTRVRASNGSPCQMLDPHRPEMRA